MNKREREDEGNNDIHKKRFKSFEGQKISPTNPPFLNLLDKMIGLNNFPKEIHNYLKYYFTKNIQHFKLVNIHDNKQFRLKSFERELNYIVSQFDNDFRDTIKNCLLLHNNIQLATKEINLLRNKLYSDTDSVKNLSDDSLLIDRNIITFIDNKEYLQILIQEKLIIASNISITNKRIEEVSSQLKKLEDKRDTDLNNLQTYTPKFIDLKVQNISIFEKIKDYNLKIGDLFKDKNAIREISVIKSFIKIDTLKFINDKIHLKEIIDNHYEL
jgi:hypothetical protein